MAEQHRATAEQWQSVKERNCFTVASCLLELRDRVEALEAAHPAESNHPAKPDSSLVERVANAIVEKATSAGIVNDRPARAAIREVAAWLREKNYYGVWVWAQRLEQEAKR